MSDGSRSAFLFTMIWASLSVMGSFSPAARCFNASAWLRSVPACPGDFSPTPRVRRESSKRSSNSRWRTRNEVEKNEQNKFVNGPAGSAGSSLAGTRARFISNHPAAVSGSCKSATTSGDSNSGLPEPSSPSHISSSYAVLWSRSSCATCSRLSIASLTTRSDHSLPVLNSHYGFVRCSTGLGGVRLLEPLPDSVAHRQREHAVDLLRIFLHRRLRQVVRH